MSTTILMIDDDPALLRLVEMHLTRAGYSFVAAVHGIAGLQLLESKQPDLILLDVNMPKLDGWETCRLIREVSPVPVIMLTARGEENDKARGLDLGADDYVTKPFGFVELQARIRAILRRTRSSGEKQVRQKADLYIVGPLVVDVLAHTVLRDGEPISLTPTEFRLLAYLLKNAGLALSHRQILHAVWGDEYGSEVDLLKPVISRLRQKVEEFPMHPQLIQTVHGVGYRCIVSSKATEE